MNSERLYYQNSYIKEFSATVLECRALSADNEKYRFATVLDRTAFFPEGGGQPADTGYIDGVEVFDVQEKNGTVYHYTDKPLTIGQTVSGTIDYEKRFRLMQNHGGEHIVSGIVNRRFGFNNVGFHMGSEDITIDYDGYLDRNELLSVENEANRMVCANLNVRSFFPSSEELKNIKYRSKKALEGDIRIVEIEDCDICACCAPHLSKTGEIGIIKLLDAYRYKGGVRVHLHCGLDALDDYNRKYEAVKAIAGSLSTGQNDVVAAFSQFEKGYEETRAVAAKLREELLKLKVETLQVTGDNIFLYEHDLSGDGLRRLADMCADKCSGMAAVFSATDSEGVYNYCIVSRNIPLRSLSKEINDKINGKGGGSDKMIQGRAECDIDSAREYFNCP